MKVRYVVILGMISAVFVYFFLLEPFNITFGYDTFLETVFGDNKNMGLAFSIVYFAAILFGSYKLYKYVKIKYELE